MNRSKPRGCPNCSKKRRRVYNNILSITHPELLEEWNHDKNLPLLPSECSAGSKKKVWWTCKVCGREWKADVYSRTIGRGCPHCYGNAPKAVRNLDTGEIYANLRIAAESCGLSFGHSISMCCQGKLKTAGGYHWEYFVN